MPTCAARQRASRRRRRRMSSRSSSARPPPKIPIRTRPEASSMQVLPYRRLAGFYFFYFAYLGAFAPFFSLYLEAAGMSAVDIGLLMALPQLTRLVAPHLWGWLADSGPSRMSVVRWTGLL